MLIRRIIEPFWRSDPRPDARALAAVRAHSPDARGGERAHRAAFAFIEKLAHALHRYGYAAPNIEDALTLVASRLGIRGDFYATPTAIFATLEWQDHEETFLIRVEPGTVNLDKLSRLDRLAHDVADGRIPPAEASRMIDEIRATPPRYRGKTRVIAAALGSACSARFFGGGWHEIVVCAAIGCIVGLMTLLARRDPRLRMFEPVAAFLAGVIATAAAVHLPPTSLFVATCGGLIILLPGLTLTTAISELATQHLASGTARMMAALMLFLTIGFGLAVGLKTGSALFGAPPQADPVSLAWWTLALALVLAPLGFIVIFQANPHDAGWIIAVCALAFGCARLGSESMGVATGAFAGALAVGVASGTHSRWRNRPALVTSTPGLLMLVPGSVGFRSITNLLDNDPVQGLQTAFVMVLTAVALVTGLLMARFLVPRRRWFK